MTRQEQRFYDDIHKLTIIQDKILKEMQKSSKGNSVDKIYIVIRDNGMTFEDYYECIDQVFLNKEMALEYAQQLEKAFEAKYIRGVENNEYTEHCHCRVEEFAISEEYRYEKIYN